MKYHAVVRKDMVLEFDFDDDEIEDGDDEFIAASEFAETFSYLDWEEEYCDIDVVRIL